jgi:UDP-2,4-diacetamido-2,4,6-trideoxy-beta-L-altropyranose hydrolase
MKILFRLDAGESAGLGHLMRCVALAQALMVRGIDSFFLIKTDTKNALANLISDLADPPLKYEFLPVDMDEEHDLKVIEDLYREVYSFLILDHYDHEIEYQQKLKALGVKWAQFDFECKQKIIADVLINGNMSANRVDYKELVSIKTALCVGYEYAIVGDAFTNQKCNPEPKRILIAMGGGKYPQDVLYLIKEITSHAGYRFEIVTTDDRVLDISKNASNVRVYLNAIEVSSVYKKCEIAIVAGGVTTFELAALQIPMLIVPYELNQRRNGLAWEKHNYAISFENVGSFIVLLRQKSLRILYSDLLNKFNYRFNRIDGSGASRIVETIISLQEGEYERC